MRMVQRSNFGAIAFLVFALVLVLAATAWARGVPGVSRDLHAAPTAASTAAKSSCPGSLGNPGVQPPNAKLLGKTYGEWGAAWWQWVFSVPYPSTPIFDPSGQSCGLNQSGPVWFLAGSAIGPVTRSCVVPADKALFFPIANLEDDWPCPWPFGPAPGQSLEDFLTADAANYVAYITDLNATVDGVPLVNLFCYRGTSHLFTFTGDPALTAVFDPCITGTPQQAVNRAGFSGELFT